MAPSIGHYTHDTADTTVSYKLTPYTAALCAGGRVTPDVRDTFRYIPPPLFQPLCKGERVPLHCTKLLGPYAPNS